MKYAHLTRHFDLEVLGNVLYVGFGHGDAACGGVGLTGAVNARHAEHRAAPTLPLKRVHHLKYGKGTHFDKFNLMQKRVGFPLLK